MKRNSLFSGALVLSIGGILAKIFSSVYRIALTRILGGEGIGLYQLIFPFYSLCVVLATSGLPLAISKVVAKSKGGDKSVIKKCLLFTSIISLSLTLILMLFSSSMAKLQGDERITVCYLILAPTIIIVSACSVFRGYFQGKHYFTPSALSNILEQFTKLVLGLVLTISLLKVSLIASIVGAMLSIVVSEIVSVIVLLIFFKKRERVETNSPVLLKDILKDVLPITLTNIIMPISNFIDSLLVVNLLSFSFSKPISIFLYGLESGAVSSIVGLPSIFSFAIASVILPNLIYSENKENKISLAVRIILIITVPCVLLFSLFPQRLISVLYGARLNGYGYDGLNIASRLLAFSSLGIVFFSINQIYSSCLQAIEERFVAIRNLSIAVIIKFVLEILFLPSAKINIFALSIANTMCYVSAFTLNHLEIKKHFKFKINYKFFAKLILSCAVMLLSIIIVFMFGGGIVNTIIGVLVGGSVYLTTLAITKTFTRSELKLKG